MTSVELTLEQIAVRDRETNEEATKWRVNAPDLEYQYRGDTPREALDFFGACVESDDDDTVDLTELENDT